MTTVRLSISAPSERVAMSRIPSARSLVASLEDDGHTEPLCLLKSSMRKLPSAYTPWKAEVILNAGTRSSLATNGLWVEQDCAQTFGRGVDRGGEPSWAGSHDGHVVEPRFRRGPGT